MSNFGLYTPSISYRPRGKWQYNSQLPNRFGSLAEDQRKFPIAATFCMSDKYIMEAVDEKDTKKTCIQYSIWSGGRKFGEFIIVTLR